MSGRRRSFTLEYRVEAAHRVIDGNRPVAEVALELNLHENLLHKWVSQERRRMAAADAGVVPDPGDGQALSPDERAELVRLRAKVAEQAKDIAFLEKASAYFAGKHLK
ncbi:transposase [Mycobacterium syngnathidarum]